MHINSASTDDYNHKECGKEDQESMFTLLTYGIKAVGPPAQILRLLVCICTDERAI